MYVVPSQRKSGKDGAPNVARSILEALEQAARESGWKTVKVETSKAMAAVLTATPRGARSSCCFDLPVKVDLHRFCSGQVLMLGGPLFEGTAGA